VQVRRGDQDSSRLFAPGIAEFLVVAGADQDPVARFGGVDGRLDRPELPRDVVPGTDSQDVRVGGGNAAYGEGHT
jgi:hypothetical protein